MSAFFNTLTSNFAFELRSVLRRPTLYVCTALLFSYWLIFSARLKMDPNFWGPNAGVFANAPVVLYFTLATQAFVTFLFVPLLMGQGPLREQGAQLSEPWLTTPMRPSVALWGRFLASFGLLSLATFVASSGVILSPYLRLALGKIPGLSLGPVPWAQLLHAWGVLMLPTLFFASALVFWLTVLVRKSTAAIVATIVLVMGAVVSHYFGKTLHFEALQLIDPTAFHAVHRSVAYWTLDQRNHDFLPITKLLLANRIIWVSAGLLIGAVASVSFSRSRFLYGSQRKSRVLPLRHEQDRSSRERGYRIEEPCETLQAVAPRAIFSKRLWVELKQLLFNPLYNALLAIFLIWLWGQHYGFLELDFIRPQADAPRLLLARRGLWMLVFYFLPWVAASTVFYERRLPGSEYFDTLPIPNWLQWLPKLCALCLYCGIFPLLVGLASLQTQLVYAELGGDAAAYAQVLLGSYYPFILQFVILAFSISILCPNRAVAYAVTMLVLYASIFGYETSNLQHELGLQMHESMFLWSPFDGMGPYAPKVWSKGMFWLGVSALALTIATNYYKRGHRSRFGARWTLWRGLVCLALAGVVIGTGLYAQRQSQAWTQTRLRPAEDKTRVLYERELGQYRDAASPKVEDFQLQLALHPAQARFSYELQAAIVPPETQSELFVQSPVGSHLELKLDDAVVKPVYRNSKLGAQVYPLSPSTRTLTVQSQHEFLGHPKKKERPLGVVDNGSYLNQKALASFQYDPQIEVSTTLERSVQGLGPRAPRPERGSSVSRDCAWRGGFRSWTIALSTSIDQYAIAPGKLVKSWTKGGRRHFRYASERPDCSELAFSSGRFESLQTQWHGDSQTPVDIRVLHLDGYEDSAQQIQDLVQRALSKLHSILGEYPYSTLQVVQARDDAPLGIAPANTLFLRQSEAWDLRVQSPQDEHQRLYYITFRLAQHWMHNRVAPADLPGKGLFNEGIPAYLAYAWLEELFGETWLKSKYLTRAMRRYFWYHGAHTPTETSVIKSLGVEHIDVYKAALALRVYARALGQERLNVLLRELVQSSGHEGFIWTSEAFKKRIDQAMESSTNPSLPSEMLGEIVHYDNRVNSATWTQLPSGRYRLALELFAQRWETTPASPTPTLTDWVRPLNVAIRLEGPDGDQETLELLDVRNGVNRIELDYDARPSAVRIDPEMKLLDVSLKDQHLPAQKTTDP